MSIKVTKIYLWLALLGIQQACGTWAGNPKDPDEDQNTPIVTDTTKGQVNLKIVGDSSGTGLVSKTIDTFGVDGNKTGDIVLTEARLSLRKIKLIAADNSENDHAAFEGPYIVDLLTNTTKPSIETLSIPEGEYSELKLQLAKLEKDEVGNIVQSNDPLVGKSINLVGNYVDLNNQPTPFQMSFELDEEFFIRLSGSNVDIVTDAVNSLVITFYLHKWFDFSGQDFDLDDVIGSEIILSKDASEDESKELQEAIKDNIKDSAEFAKEQDDH